MKYVLLLIPFLIVACVGEFSLSEYPIKKEQLEISNDSLSVAGFNIQIFGKSKMDKELAVTYIPKIIQNFDIVAVQEVRDSSGTAIVELDNILIDHKLVISDRLGRTSSKEQYAVFYNDEVQVIDSFVYYDEGDKFEREPFIVVFDDGIMKFNLIVVHVKPDDAEIEIALLDEVVEAVVSQTKVNEFILLGDLNSDCSYFDEDVEFLSGYFEMIDDSMDTTVSNSVCTYDRIFTNMRYGTGGVYNFEEIYGLSQEDALIISDHFPVFVEFE